MIAAGVYVLCALTAALCAVLLFQAWSRTRLPLLFWSGLCFAGLTASNVLLVVDLLVVPGVDLFVWRKRYYDYLAAVERASKDWTLEDQIEHDGASDRERDVALHEVTLRVELQRQRRAVVADRMVGLAFDLHVSPPSRRPATGPGSGRSR